MKKIILILLIFYFSILTAKAQVQQEWVARLNGPGNFNDVAYAMTLDASGNIYVTGTVSTGTGSDIATIKYNPAGTQIWMQMFNGGTHDVAFVIFVDNLGNVYVAGSSQGGNGADYITVKYNSFGAQQWFQIYEGPAFEEDGAASVAIDASGNVYVTGFSTGIGTAYDYATIKYNLSGVEQWVQRFNDPGNGEDVASSLALDGSGNIYVTGRSNFNYTTIKYNPSGVQQWIQTYNGPGNGNDAAGPLKVDGSDNIYITGMSMGNGTNYDYATIKYNSSGSQQWVQRYNGPSNNYDYASSLAVDASGSVYVTGNSFDDFATVKYNSSGVQQWVQRYNGPGNAGDYAYSIALDATNNVYVTGYSFGNGTTLYDFATIKYNTSGTEQWVQRYNGPGNFYDIPFSIAVDGSGNVYVAGESGGNGSGLDFATVKYSQLVGIEPISNEIPNSYSLFQNYPNPFNPATNVKFQIPNSGFIQLKVFDMLGREAATLVNEQLNPGTYEVVWDASNYPSGVYYYKFIAGDYSDIKKMVLVK